MKTIYSIIVVLIAIVVLYLIYKYLFPQEVKTEESLTVSGPRPLPVNVVLPTTVSSECSKLPSMKIVIDDLLKVVQVHYDDMKKGFAITKGGINSNPEDLKNIFETSYYTYRNEIVKYNGIVSQYKCSGVEMENTVVFANGPVI